MKKIILYPFLILSVLISADIIASFLWFNSIINKEKSRFDKKAQVSVVFMGPFEKNYRHVGKDTLRRIHHAVNLYNKNLIGGILCVGGSRPNKNVFGSEMMKEALIAFGVPSEKIFTETKSYDSISNWRMATQIIKANHWKTVVVISSPLHVHRLRKIISDKPMKHLKVFFSPYSYQSYKDTTLNLSSFEIWRQIKHEWIAYLINYILPDSLYRSILRIFRHQDSTLLSNRAQSSSTIS